MKNIFILILIGVVSGFFISPLLSNVNSSAVLISAIPWFTTLPILLFTACIFLSWKFNDLSGTDGIKIQESERLKVLIKEKALSFITYAGVCFVTTIVYLMPRLFSSTIETEGGVGKYFFFPYLTALVSNILILVSILKQSKDLIEFNSEIKHKIKEAKDRKEYLNEIKKDGEKGFSSDQKLDSYNLP